MSKRRRQRLPTSCPPLFRPLPLLGNGHVQTLVAHLFPGPLPVVGARARNVTLSDGDRLVLHDSAPAGWQSGQRMALLVHGLGGSHESPTMVRVTAALLAHGVRVVRMDLRGVGRGAALARRTYYGGCSSDVRAVLDELYVWSPASPVTLIGFSLGGNIVLKLAGEYGAKPAPNLAGVAALAPPIDLLRCSALLERRANRFYDLYFVRSLIRQVRRQQHFFPDVPRVRFPERATLRQFDDLYTAPRWGFADAHDYYRRASSAALLERITVPTLIVSARDDPFIAVEPFEALARSNHLEIELVAQGGHLGFLGRDGAGGIRWGERRLVEWVLRLYC